MHALFVYNNLKVDPWQVNIDLTPKDTPFPGFELLTWETNASVTGTLWDIGGDAGYYPDQWGSVYGQIWITEDWKKIKEMEEFLGVYAGLTEPMKTTAYIIDKDLVENIAVTIYKLREIKKKYTIVSDVYTTDVYTLNLVILLCYHGY